MACEPYFPSAKHYFVQAEIIFENGMKKILPTAIDGVCANQFCGELSMNDKLKIYVVLNYRGTIIYVGKTTQVLAKRLAQGLNRNKTGYKWQEKESVSIHCFIFNRIQKDALESIEAELAFQVRKSTGAWPDFQSDIRFTNDCTAMKYGRECMQLIDRYSSYLKSNTNSSPIKDFCYLENIKFTDILDKIRT